MKKKDYKKDLGNSINDAIIRMDFDDISKKIKAGVDQAIQSTVNLIGSKNKTSLPQTRRSEICAQKLPEKSKASSFKLLALMFAFIGLGGFFITFDGLDYGSFEQIFVGLVSILSAGIFTPYFWKKSNFLNKISQNYMRFLRELGNNTVIPVRDLASAVQQSEEDTVKDLLYMMRKGYFHQARIVEDDSLFILDIDTFKLYKNQAAKMNKVEKQAINKDVDDKRADSIISLGGDMLSKIEENKEKIKNGVFLEKVDEICQTIANILSLIKKYPDKAYALDKFMDYYLPTTTKLIDAYIEFENMNSGDEKIISSMTEIEKSISTINEAFEKIQVELLTDRAMDIKTDIDTMKLLLNQEGLLEDDWSKE